jgi:asparagine synthase (glutamine-hydrolysing)
MCGIAGIINLNKKPVSADILKKMTDQISHRGPDDEGMWIENNVGIGHRRLKILDLSSFGHQPMISSNNRWILSYNGEIYNYKELRKELVDNGFKFKSQTDTEVVLYSLVNWGEDAFIRFNGMFALALWDRQKKIMLLGRDRYGIKPLYYSNNTQTFSFGSEQKAILSQPEFKKNLNKFALKEYFTFQNIFTNQTLIDGINLLPAGCYAKIHSDSNSKSLELKRYWDYRFSEPNKSINYSEYVEELDRLFRQAVKRQMISDVEIGAYLSGGIDSGSITALAAKEIPNLKSFTCGFDLSSASGIELGFDERIKAESMSAKFKTEHYEMILKAGDMERCLPKLVHHLEEPRVGQSYPNFYVAHLASKFVKVVLSGSGGDELFGGYPWRYYRAATSQSFDEYIENYYSFWQRLVSDTELNMLLGPISNDTNEISTKEIFKNIFTTHDNSLDKPEDYINHSFYFEAKTFLHSLFIVEDKLSMAHGLESRVPFMDNDLVNFAMQCPVSFKLNNLKESLRINENEPGRKKLSYFNKTSDGKQILRDMSTRYIPKEISEANKKGFSSPDASWFRGESMEYVKRYLLKNDAIINNYLDKNSIEKLLNEHLNGEKNRRLLIWSLLSFETYLKENFP